MKITHVLEKEGAKWDTFNGAAEWTRNGFTRAGFTDYAYRFDNGDIWDKVNGWRNNDLKVIVPKFDHWKYTTQGIMPIIATNQGSIYSCSISPRGDDLWPARDTSVSPSMRGSVHSAPSTMLLIDDYESGYLNEREQLCSRHLWQ